jgi:hypothetical protein
MPSVSDARTFFLPCVCVSFSFSIVLPPLHPFVARLPSHLALLHPRSLPTPTPV